jgi:hypothetical protein
MARGTEEKDHADDEPEEDPYPAQSRDVARMDLSFVNPVVNIEAPGKAENGINGNDRKKKGQDQKRVRFIHADRSLARSRSFAALMYT